MQTYATLDAARAAVTDEVRSIIAIDHATAGRCYILAKCSKAELAAVIAKTPLEGVERIVAGYPARKGVPPTPAQVERRAIALLRDEADHYKDSDSFRSICARSLADNRHNAWRAAYPAEAAREAAEGYQRASHDVKSAAGKRALARLANGEDRELVLAEMHAEWSDWCSAHVD